MTIDQLRKIVNRINWEGDVVIDKDDHYVNIGVLKTENNMLILTEIVPEKKVKK